MKGTRSFVYLALALAAVALVVIGFPADALAAVLPVKATAAGHFGDLASLMFHASPALVALRKDLETLSVDAARKLEEVKAEGLSVDQVRAIEAEHGVILGKIEAKRAEITAAETAANAPGADPLVAERARAAEIIAIGARHNLQQAMVSRAIADGVTLDAFRGQALEALAANAPGNAVRGTGAAVQVIHPGESPAERRSAMADGLIMRSLGHVPDGSKGRPKIDNEARSREFAGMSLLELGAELAGIRNAHRMHKLALYETLVERSMLGTTDYPLLLSAAANKFLLAAYQYQAPTYRKFSAKKQFNDFKSHNFLRAGDFPLLEQLTETGEFRNGSISENREQVTAATYGKIIGLSRQMFVNDDLGAFADLTALAGRRVADFENSVAWGVILSNTAAGPALSDTGNVFNSTAVTTAGGHANLAGAAAAITTASIDLGFTSMLQKKGLDGAPLNLLPSILVVGPQKRTEALQLLSTNLLATQISNVNPFSVSGDAGKLDLAVDAYIGDKSWYLFADPVVGPVFIWGYVSGFEGPRFAIDQPFRQDGLALKVVEDFGFGAVDFRGGYRNAGA
jgi:hypothetical protein